MMRSKTEFLNIKGFKSPEFDEEISQRKRSVWRDLQVIYRSLGTLNGYWPIILALVAMGIFYSCIWVLVPFIDKVLFDDVLPVKDWNAFWVIIGLWIGIYLIGGNGLFGFIKNIISNNIAMKLGMWVQINFFRHIQKLSLQRVERKGVGDFMYRIHRDAADASMVAWGTLNSWIGAGFSAILFVSFVAFIDPFLLAVVLAYQIFNFVAWTLFAGWYQKVEFMMKQAKTYADARMQEGFAGIETVKCFGRQKGEGAAYVRRVAVQLRTDVMVKMLNIIRQVFLRHSGIFPWWQQMGIMLFMYWRIIHGEATYGEAVAIIAYVKEMQKPVEDLIHNWFALRRNVVRMDRYFQIWDTPAGIEEAKDPMPVPEFKGNFSVQNLSYAYDNGIEVLHDIDLQIRPGEFVAVVGPSGSGKSTLLNLMLRLEDPASGTISVDGIDIRRFKSSEYQRRIGTVLQETFLSKETLRWNLMLGNYFATDEEMIDALEQCQLGDWFRKLPEGLESFLDEGSKVSGGEKQRLGVVRAILRKSQVLFLDEPTSALDLEIEAEVMEVIHRVRKNKTTVMVTHRLDTIRTADRIIVMDKGNIVEEGTHAKLLAAKGRYYELVTLYHREGPSIEGQPAAKTAAA